MKTLIFTLAGIFFFSCANAQIMQHMINQIGNGTEETIASSKSDGNESAWEKVYQLPAQQMPVGIEVVDEKTIWVYSSFYNWITPSQDEQYLYRSTDGGFNWEKIRMAGQLEFSAIDSMNVWASVAKIGIIKTSNGGQTWDTLLNTERFGPIHFFNQNDGISILCFNTTDGLDNGDSLVIYRTNNGGLNWSLIDPVVYGGTIASEACASINNDNMSTRGDNLYFTTTRNRIIYTTNKGNSWDQIPSPFDNSNEILTSVKAKDNLHISVISGGYMDGATNFVWRDYPIIASTTDGGITWAINSCLHLSNSLCESIIPGNDSVSLIGAYDYNSGSGGTMISNDFGANYTLIDSTSNLMVIKFLNSNTGFGVTFNNNDSRVADTDYILKWKPGIYSEREFWQYNENLPESCFEDSVNVTNNKKIDLSMFPNPCNGLLNIAIPQIASVNGMVQIFDYLGRPIITQTVSSIQQGETVTIDLSKKPSGIYLVRLKIGKEEFSGKVLLVK